MTGCMIEGKKDCRRTGPLTVWARATPGSILKIKPKASKAIAFDGGMRWRIDKTPSAGDLRVTAQLGSVETEWALPLRYGAARPCGSASDWSAKARSDFGAGRVASADRWLAKAARAYDRCNFRSRAIRDRLLRVHLRLAPTSTAAVAVLGQDRLLHAQTILADIDGHALLEAKDQVNVAYYRGLLHYLLGDLGRASASLRVAALEAARVELVTERVAAESIRIPVLARMGRLTAVEPRMADLERAIASLGRCQQGAAYVNLAWARVLANEESNAFGPRSPGARTSTEAVGITALLRRAADLNADCPRGATTSHLNLAIHALHFGDWQGAQSALAVAERLGIPADSAPWRMEIMGRLAMAQAKWKDAMRAFEAERAMAGSDHDSLRRAWTGIARAHEAMGHPQQALQAYARAEDVADDALRVVGLDQGQSAFAARQQTNTRALVSFLIARGAYESAFQAARRGRARGLKTIARLSQLEALSPQQHRDWARAVTAHETQRSMVAVLHRAHRLASRVEQASLSRRLKNARVELDRTVDQALRVLNGTPPGPRREQQFLPSQKTGELTLLAYRGRSDWLVFAADTATVSVTRHRTAPEPNAPFTTWSDWLLAPAAHRIRASKRLRVLPTDVLRDVDVHALPFDGAPLIASVEVVYGLDLRAPKVIRATKRTAVFADPEGDLPGARREAQVVQGHLSRRYDAVEVRVGHNATKQAFESSLGEVDLLHFAGHATASDRPLGASLRLAGRETLSTAEVLVLPRVPPEVVLLGCSTGRTPRKDAVASIEGLAQAFVAAGTSAVVATHRPIRDALAVDIAQTMYSSSDTVVAAATRAQRTLSAEAPPPDWAAIRIWVP